MSRIVPTTTSKILLTEGDSVVIGTQASGASGTTFAVPAPAAGGAGRDVVFTTDTVTSMTTLTADLECSSDAGTTWNKFKTTMALIATSVGAAVIATNVPPALIYRINVTSTTGTSCSVLATVS
jgi:hypothetical protein